MTANETTKKALHFETSSYPRFGRGVYSDAKAPSTVRNSPFFWWFRFLQLNSDYLATEKTKGIGVCADLYKDFGDVSYKDFKTWWKEHSHLFAEEASTYTMKVARSQNDLAPFDVSEAVNLVVPLTWSQKSLKKHFAMLITKLGVEQGKRGPKIGSETARYSLGRRWNCGAMESAYNVYVIRLQNMEKGAKETKKSQHKGEVSAKFKMAWADVAIAAKLNIAEGMQEGKVSQSTTEKRRILTILADRHYKKAESFIKAAATKGFPSLD